MTSIYDDLGVEYDDLNPDYDDLKSIYDDLHSGHDDLKVPEMGGLMDLKADAKNSRYATTFFWLYCQETFFIPSVTAINGFQEIVHFEPLHAATSKQIVIGN